jgi:enolase-phosphatase E1
MQACKSYMPLFWSRGDSMSKAIRAIITDIEGTTTPLDFVKKILFPFSSKHLNDYVRARIENNEMHKILLAVNNTAKEEFGITLDTTGAIALLQRWIEEDRKHPALKEIQGMMWHDGYKAEAFRGEVYQDVAPSLNQWKSNNILLGVYSSGSVQAQKDLFTFSSAGNLAGLFRYFFDTKIGAKQDVKSYEAIVKTLTLAPSDILFLSDVIAELDAAKAAGMHTIQLVREGTTPGTTHPTAADFHAVSEQMDL